MRLGLLSGLWMGLGTGPSLGAAHAADAALASDAAAQAKALLPVYEDLHRHPELSLQEVRTAGLLADRLRALGFTVTTQVGGVGVVGVLANGAGPTVLLRADMDGLPVAEETGAAYQSRARGRDDAGRDVPVMHACGHDAHMTAWLGTAAVLAARRSAWRGTLVVVGQPAEEVGQGAKRLLDDGLYRRFPRPDYALALHVSAELPAGTVGYTAGPALASVDSVDITIYGRGGHGAYPHRTIDPIVIAARLVTALQTLVSRENNPLDPAVVTVGSIHGGSKHNVIPDEVQLQLTVRAYSADVRKRLLAGIQRLARAEAAAAGAPREPTVTSNEATAATHNDPALAERAAKALGAALGAARVRAVPPVMAGEDFGEYGRAGARALIFWVGASPEARPSGAPAPSLHSSRFLPVAEPTLRTGIHALAALALDLLK